MKTLWQRRPNQGSVGDLTGAAGCFEQAWSQDGPVKDVTLPLAYRLREALDAQGVAYCQWKGHAKRHRWGRGKGDIDLLVARADEQRFTSVLCQLGFKLALPPLELQIPGICSYYGFDAEANKFVHIHVHYLLILGDNWTRSYHLPIESQILQAATRGDFFPVPEPEFELIVFVIRAVLGFSGWSIRGRGQANRLALAQKELEYLTKSASVSKIHDILELHFPFLDVAFFDRCLQALRPGCSNWRRWAIRRQLRSRLEVYARHQKVSQALQRARSWLRNRSGSLFFGRTRRKHLAKGGALIALVGGDGAGKSTAVAGLDAWLSPNFETKTFHLGRPPQSGLTFALKAALKVAALFRKLRQMYRKNPPPVCGDASSSRGYLWMLQSACTARDRYRLYVKARRFASAGGLAICDRYPLPQIKSMDGPNIGRLLPQPPASRLAALLQKTESWYYRRILPPELLYVLRVGPDLAVQRKANEDAAHVRARSQELWEVNWLGTRAQVIDGSASQEQVAAILKALVWSEL